MACWPPRELVVSGLSLHVRNPIYLGGIFFLLGFVFWHPARSILLMTGPVSVSPHLFVILDEEMQPLWTLGAVYDDCCQSVPPRLPRLRKAVRSPQ